MGTGYCGTDRAGVMLSTIIQTIRRHALFAAGDRVLLGVSAGPDSMALLAALWELAPRLELTLEVATVDHGLREVGAELALVRERSEALGLPWHHLAVDVRGAGVSRGLQEAARRARLAALARLAEARGCRRVALGHQADDQEETVLFRIVRGTGLRGLAGIPYLRAPFVRPLLDVTRAEIVRYLARRSLTFARDPSNEDLRFARARLRRLVLPVLRRENPRIGEALRRLAAEANRPVGELVPGLAAARASGVHVSARLQASLERAAGAGGTRTFDAEGGHRLTVGYGSLTVAKQGPRAAGPGRRRRAHADTAPAGEVIIAKPGRFVFDGRTAVVLREVAPARSGARATSGPPARAHQPPGDERWVWFDGEALAWPLTLRARRAGDRMRPRGGRGSRKLSDLLIDAKIPREARDRRPVVASAEGELLFVPGLRPSQTGAPTEFTRRLVGMAAVPMSGRPDSSGDFTEP